MIDSASSGLTYCMAGNININFYKSSAVLQTVNKPFVEYTINNPELPIFLRYKSLSNYENLIPDYCCCMHNILCAGTIKISTTGQISYGYVLLPLQLPDFENSE